MIQERWMRSGEAAKRLGVSRATIGRWRKRGYVEGIKQPSGQYKYAESEVDRVLVAMKSRTYSNPRAL